MLGWLIRDNVLNSRDIPYRYFLSKWYGNPKDNGERSVIADNAMDRQFAADRPSQKRVADFT